ncbi:T9SS type A sorting domain-containing protein, partial [Winogradskyella sp.]|uniref:T9SS type A sorting domain-containing protein n=1 Tax=Winogradskyella sp. TaxID=1883156 RepID=UPI003F69892D
IGAGSLDISGYTIEDGFGLRHTFPASTILPSNSFITVFGGGTPTGIPGLTQVSSEGGLGLNNGGDDVIVKNGSGVVVVSYTYTGATDQSVARSPDYTGTFVAHSTITGNGGALFSPNNENDTVLSTNDFSNVNFSIYPNPTNTGNVTITSTIIDAMTVQVFDVLGKQVIIQRVTNNNLDVSNLRSGLYIVKITQNNASVTKKLVIK